MDKLTLPPASFSEDLWDYLAKTEKPIVVYGMGNGADKLIAQLSLIGKEISDFFASDGFVRGQSFHGKRVLAFSEIKEKYQKFIILVSFGSHLDSVREQIISLARENELYIPDMPIAGEEYFTAAFYRLHYAEILRAYALFADEDSRRVYTNLLWYKLTGAPDYLWRAVKTGDEEELLGYETIQSAVDVGAYRGDTLKELVESCPALRTVFCIEPDPKNFAKLTAYAQTLTGKEIVTVNAAAWSDKGELSFSASGNRNAALGGKDEKIAGTASYKTRETKVSTVRLDDLLAGNAVSYVKYDTEGAELAALQGSIHTLKKHSPSLRISLYHRSEDIFALPLWLQEQTRSLYTYYLRRKPSFPAWDMELIAVNKQSEKRKEQDYFA